MQKYNQYCPVSRATEVLGDRWTLLIVREMILGSHRFNEIERGLPGISRSLLASRLRNLVDAGIVERLPGARSKLAEYYLSETGRDLKKVIEALGAWGCDAHSANRGRRSSTPSCWCGRFTNGSTVTCCPRDVRLWSSTSRDLARTAHGWSCNQWRCRCA